MFYDHKKKEILDFIKECYQLTFDTTSKITMYFRSIQDQCNLVSHETMPSIIEEYLPVKKLGMDNKVW